MQGNSLHHKLFRFDLSSWIWKCGKKGKKLQKLEYPENEKSFLDEIKNIFIVFEGLSFRKKEKKNLIKNSGHKL